MTTPTPANKEKASPANAPLSLPKGYKPMSSGVLRLEVPEKSGWHRHWFRGTPERLARAQQAGYRFTSPDEVEINSFDVAGDSKGGGSTDLGSRVSVISGDDIGSNGQPGRMYLMECPQEYFEHAQGILQETNDGVAEALRGGNIGSEKEVGRDANKRYLKDGQVPSLFQKKS